MNNLQSSAFVAKTTQLLSSVAHLRLLLVMLLTLTVSAEVWGQTTATLTLSSSKKFGTTSGSTLTDDKNNTWTCTGSTIQNTYNTTYKGQQFGTSKNAGNYTFTCTIAGATISSVKITAAAGSTSAKYSISVGGSSKYSGNLSKTSTTYGGTNATGSGEISISLQGSGTGAAVYLGSITVIYTTASATKHTVTFDAGSNGTCNTTSLTEVSAGAGVTLPDVTPNSGYRFLGWATTSSATTSNAGTAGETYNPTKNITLYAVYKQQCTITWLVDGNAAEGSPTTKVDKGGKVTTLPTTPTLDCSGKTFVGWSNQEVTDGNKPSVLFTDAASSPAINANITFYAVFAKKETTPESSISTPYKFEITSNNFNTTSYAANNNEKTTKATATDGSNATLDVKWTSNQVMKGTGDNSGAMQWQKNAGYIYNSTNLGTINSVTVTSTAGTFTTYYGTTSQPSSGNSGNGKGYFKTSIGGATGYASKIVIAFTLTTSTDPTTEISDYTTQCITETVLFVDPKKLDFGDVSVGQQKQMTFTLTGQNITNATTLSISGDSQGFSVSPFGINDTGNFEKEIIVTYAPTATGDHSQSILIKSSGADDVTVTLSGTGKAQTANYTIKHYQQNLDGTYPSTPTNTETKSGEVGTEVTPTVKTYPGFTAPSTKTVTIKSDGSTEVDYQYTRNSYTLTWNLDGGTIVTAGTTAGLVKYGASLTAPTVTKEEYNFKNWNPTVPSTMPASDATYTAQWTPVYTITWMLNGQVYHTQSAVEGTILEIPSAPNAATYTCNDKVFVGWTENPIAGNTNTKPTDLFTSKSSTLTTNATYYAVFADVEDVASTDYEKITDASDLTDGKYVIAYGYNTTTPSIILEATTINATTLVATSSSPSSNKYQNPAAKNIWTIKKDGTSYTLYNEATKKYIQATTTPALLLSDANPTNFVIESSDSYWKIKISDYTSYQLVGYTNSSGNYFQTKSGVSASYKIQLYKNTSTQRFFNYSTNCIMTYVISFDLKGHGLDQKPEEQIVEENGTVTEPSPAPKAEGYDFGGWFTDSECTSPYDFSSPVTASFTLYAKWTAIEYTITYDNLNGGNNDANPKTYTIESETITLKNLDDTNTHHFVGWYDEDDNLVTKIPQGSTGDITLYAKWVEIFTVKWYANGKELTNGELGSASRIVYEGEHISNLPPSVNLNNYCGDFVGWTDAEMDVNNVAKPNNLYTQASEFPNATGNQEFFAVFAE